MTTCISCNAALPDGTAFCTSCGRAQHEEPGAQARVGRAEATTKKLVEHRGKGFTAAFISALFDFSFHHFVTPMLVQLLYILLLAISALAALICVLFVFGYNSAAGRSGAESVIESVVAAPLIFALGAIFARFLCEVAVAITRIAENTESLKDRQ